MGVFLKKKKDITYKHKVIHESDHYSENRYTLIKFIFNHDFGCIPLTISSCNSYSFTISSLEFNSPSL